MPGTGPRFSCRPGIVLSSYPFSLSAFQPGEEVIPASPATEPPLGATQRRAPGRGKTEGPAPTSQQPPVHGPLFWTPWLAGQVAAFWTLGFLTGANLPSLFRMAARHPRSSPLAPQLGSGRPPACGTWCQSARAVLTQHHRPGALKNGMCLSPFWRRKSKVRVLASWVSPKAPPWLVAGCPRPGNGLPGSAPRTCLRPAHLLEEHRPYRTGAHPEDAAVTQLLCVTLEIQVRSEHPRAFRGMQISPSHCGTRFLSPLLEHQLFGGRELRTVVTVTLGHT